MIEKLRSRTQGLYNQTTSKEYKVDLAFSNHSTRFAYTASEQNKARYVDQKTLEGGFDVIKINGVDWVVDEFTPGSQDGTTADNFLYILSTASMMLFYKYGFDRKSPLTQTNTIIPNQPIMFNINYLAGNIACENRRVNGLFKTLIA